MGNDIVEDDANSVFVVYVPPNTNQTNGNTFESCLRLGAGPNASNMATQDENQTYHHAIAASPLLRQLSEGTYHPANGIALLTPGTINLVGAGGVNITSSSAYTNSSTGSTYTITQEPGSNAVVSASYSGSNLGSWATLSFNRATTVSVATVPLQASLTTAIASYALSGPISFTNAYGLTFSSMIGFSVTAQLARVTNIGWRTIVSNKFDGSNNAYYSKDQQSSTAKGFQWSVPKEGLYAELDTLQHRWCTVVNVASAAIDLAAVTYSIVFLGVAIDGSPSNVQGWLKAAEPIAIACTALNGILAVAGLVLSVMVDDFMDEPDGADPNSPDPAKRPNPHNVGATSLTLESGKITLTNGCGASITLDGNTIKIEAMNVTVSSPNFKTVPSNAGAGDLAPGAIPGPSGAAVA